MRTYTYCAEDQPFSIVTDYCEVEINFDTDPLSPRDRKRGFVVGYIGFTRGKHKCMRSLYVPVFVANHHVVKLPVPFEFLRRPGTVDLLRGC